MRVATSTLAQREEAKEAQRKQRIDVECEEGEMEEAERRRRGISRANRSGGPTWEKAGREKKNTSLPRFDDGGGKTTTTRTMMEAGGHRR